MDAFGNVYRESGCACTSSDDPRGLAAAAHPGRRRQVFWLVEKEYLAMAVTCAGAAYLLAPYAMERCPPSPPPFPSPATPPLVPVGVCQPPETVLTLQEGSAGALRP